MIKGYLFRFVFVCFCNSFFWGAPSLLGQTPLGSPDLWRYQLTPTYHPQHRLPGPFLGNHAYMPTDTFWRAIQGLKQFEEGGLSVFLVVKPLFDQAQGRTFLSYRNLEISDQEVLFRGSGRSLMTGQQRPLIISASIPLLSSRPRSSVLYVDTSLFRVAELVVYGRMFSKQEMRSLEAYLSLKYSIPTTKNKDHSLRAYPADSSTSYWAPQRDKIYDREVIALGNFPFSGLQQSQTLAYHEDSLVVALDSLVPFGQMPPAIMREGAFMVLSKRIDQSSAYDCERHLNRQFPITAWRLRTQNFRSTADTLRLLYPKHQTFSDTIICTDGLDTLYPSLKFKGQDLALALALEDIQPNRVYRFRVLRNDCDDTASLGLMPQAPGLYHLAVDEGRLPLHLALNRIEDGKIWETWQSQAFLAIQLEEGQYQLKVTDRQGVEHENLLLAAPAGLHQSTSFKARQDSLPSALNNPEVLVFPNPLHSGQAARFEFRGFKKKERLKMVLSDGLGRVLHREELWVGPQSSFWTHSLRVPGVYSFVFHSDNQVYNIKLIVKK